MTQPKTLDEIRDWFARRQGWCETTPAMCDDQPVPLGCEWHRPTGSGSPGSLTWCIHPIPATLDAIAGLMPDGWKWRRGYQVWVATKTAEAPMLGFEFDIPDTGNELLDRATLAYLAQIEQDKHKETKQ